MDVTILECTKCKYLSTKKTINNECIFCDGKMKKINKMEYNGGYND